MFEEEGRRVAVEERGGDDGGVMALPGGVSGGDDGVYAGVGRFDPGCVGGEALCGKSVSPHHGQSLTAHPPRGISV